MKNNKIIFLLLVSVSLMIQNGVAQPLIPRKCYLHLTGYINREFPIEVNLVKNLDTVFGECTFPGKTEGLGKFNYSGNPLLTTGKVSNDGSFLISVDALDIPLILKGSFTPDQKLKGNYEARGTSGNLTFELSESYPNGSLNLNAYFLKGSVALVKKKNSPVGEIQLSLLLPGESADPVISDSLKKLVIMRYTEREVISTDPDKILKSIAQIYYDTYVNTNLDIYNATSGQSFSWELLKYMHVVQNSSNIVSFYVEQYAFTGGANGLQTRWYSNVNLHTGKVILPEEIFQENSQEKLKNLLVAKTRDEFGIPADKALSESGFFTNEILPHSNYYITGNGIGFFYNQYDIAPRSTGTIDLFFRFDELREILVPDGILAGLLK